jgi:hypothetical protein
MATMNPFQDPPVQAGPSYGVPADDAGLPADPPPAYTPSAAQTQSTTLAAGPQRMDFSGPPPLPDRYQAPQLTGNISGQPVEGVGYGYGPRPTHDGPISPPGQMHPHHSGAHGPPPPLAPVQDNRPTSIPTPGRPLLKDGMLLVYPRGYMCKKCHNTGFKQSDPSHPCKNVRTFALQQQQQLSAAQDWKKYGKPYTGPLMISYASSTTSGSENFQRPLPLAPPPTQRPPPGIMGYPGQIPHGSHGGGGGYQPRPPQMGYGVVPQPPIMHHGYGPPAGAVVLRAGDPRLGGQ